MSKWESSPIFGVKIKKNWVATTQKSNASSSSSRWRRRCLLRASLASSCLSRPTDEGLEPIASWRFRDNTNPWKLPSPKINMESQKWWFVNVAPFLKGVFSGAMWFFFGGGKHIEPHKSQPIQKGKLSFFTIFFTIFSPWLWVPAGFFFQKFWSKQAPDSTRNGTAIRWSWSASSGSPWIWLQNSPFLTIEKLIYIFFTCWFKK